MRGVNEEPPRAKWAKGSKRKRGKKGGTRNMGGRRIG